MNNPDVLKREPHGMNPEEMQEVAYSVFLELRHEWDNPVALIRSCNLFLFCINNFLSEYMRHEDYPKPGAVKVLIGTLLREPKIRDFFCQLESYVEEKDDEQTNAEFSEIGLLSINMVNVIEEESHKNQSIVLEGALKLRNQYENEHVYRFAILDDSVYLERTDNLKSEKRTAVVILNCGSRRDLLQNLHQETVKTFPAWFIVTFSIELLYAIMRQFEVDTLDSNIKSKN